MRWFEQHVKVFVVLIGISISALVVKQGLVIGEYGVGGWLRGDGPFQTEWEVRAVCGLLLTALPAVVVVAIVRSGEGVASRLRDWRWARAVRRSREKA